MEQREYKFGGFEGGEEDDVKTESCLVPSYVKFNTSDEL